MVTQDATKDVVVLARKQTFVGAVTLLEFSIYGSLLYVGVGNSLYFYDTKEGACLGVQSIVRNGTLHGVDFAQHSSIHYGAFYGQKQLSLYEKVPQTPKDLSVFSTTKQDQKTTTFMQRIGKIKRFCDWIFDVQLLTEEEEEEEEEETRNITKIPHVAVGLAHNIVQIWDPNSNTIIKSVICTERCILYALAFHGRSYDSLIVASGTVFQQILLWDPSSDPTTNPSKCAPIQRLHSHDGVIFKLKWSKDATRLASVSDDRTVQLWSNHKLQEDGNYNTKKQVLSRPFTSSFRSWGHAARLWDVVFTSDGQSLATTSEDGLCKVWNPQGECIATLQGHVGRHVWRVAVTKDPQSQQEIIATGGGDGTVKLWYVESQRANTNVTSNRLPMILVSSRNGQNKANSSICIRDVLLSPLVNSSNKHQAIVAMDNGQLFQVRHHPVEEVAGKKFDVEQITCPELEGINLSCMKMDSTGHFLLLSDEKGTILIWNLYTGRLISKWKAHTTRILHLWWENGQSSDTNLFSASVDGILCEWKRSSSNPVGDTETITWELVGMYKSPGKAATALFVLDKEYKDSIKMRHLVCGDGRGNVFTFSRPLSPLAEASSSSPPTTTTTTTAQTPDCILRGVHGKEQVSTFLLPQENSKQLLSGGHDGYICFYTFITTNNNKNHLLMLKRIGRESIKGLTTIKQMWQDTINTTTCKDIFVFGFHASQAILVNWTSQYGLFSIECGGWRRPHGICIGNRQHEFVFSPSASKTGELYIQWHVPKVSNGLQQIKKCSFHIMYHSRMTTSIESLKNDLFVTGAEDNTIKLHKRRKLTHNAEGLECLATGTAHTTGVRCLTSFDLDKRNKSIILSAGGKQVVHAWSVIYQQDNSPAMLAHLCTFERANAEQDHRILGLATLPIADGNDTHHLVVACNSEGILSCLLLDLEKEQLTCVGELSFSQKPILCCKGFDHFVATGSTDGMICVWNLAPLLEILASNDPDPLHVQHNQAALKDLFSPQSSFMTPCFSYLAHDMGTNCLTLVKEGTVLTILSGGDDQSIFVCEFNVTNTSSCQLVDQFRTPNASGSAIKAIYSDGKIVLIGGYDQRVSLWTKSSNKKLLWQNAIFSECADIADLSVQRTTTTTTTIYEVIVVGQGLQILQFQIK